MGFGDWLNDRKNDAIGVVTGTVGFVDDRRQDVQDAATSAAGGIYTGLDYLALGSLPDVDYAYGGHRNIGYEESLGGGIISTITGDVARDVGQTPANLTAGLPETGANVGAGVGNAGYYGLAGIGQGLGAGLYGGGPYDGPGALDTKNLLVVGGLALAGIFLLGKSK